LLPLAGPPSSPPVTTYWRSPLAWVLTLASGFAALRHVGFGLLFAYRVAGCRGGGATLGAAGTGPGGFRRTGRRAQHAADATIATPDAARGEPIGRQGPLPGAAQVPGQRPGEAELGVGDGDQPGPPVGLLGAAQAGPGQAKGLLEEPEGVLDGLIASDKFCWTRHGQLRLDWWRRPLRKREPGGCTPPSETSAVERGSHAAHLRGPAGDQRTTGRAGAVGPGLPAGVGLDGGGSTARGD